MGEPPRRGEHTSARRTPRPAAMTPATPAGGEWHGVRVGEIVLETSMAGAGEPVVWIQTALIADELVPAARLVSHSGRYQAVAYHRRGYASSSPTTGPGSIRRDAHDCASLLRALGIDRSHVVGVSYSAAVALQLAADLPDRVASVCVIEPPPVHIRSAQEFRAANTEMGEDYRTRGPQMAVDRFLSRLVGPDWRRDITRYLPDGVEQITRNADTFFGTDLLALLSWEFTAADAARIEAPVLYVGGSDSGPWFNQVHQLMLDWLPQAEDVTIPGADHSLALTHTNQLAAAITAFLDHHTPGRRATTAVPGQVLPLHKQEVREPAPEQPRDAT